MPVKMVGTVILLAVFVLVLLKVVIPMAILALGLGIDLPDAFARSRKILFFYSHPRTFFLVGLLALALLGWGALRLIRKLICPLAPRTESYDTKLS